MAAGVTRPVPRGEPSRIGRRQDEARHLRRLLAYSDLYHRSQRWRRARMAGTLLIAAVAPVAVVFFPAGSETLAALGAAWLVASRTGLAWLEERAVRRAAAVQELYETDLFGLPWNAALAGPRPAPEEVVAATGRIRRPDRYRGWFGIDVEDVPWPGDVLLCQRQSMVWSLRDHRAYGGALVAAGLGWFGVGLGLALYRDMSLADYLVKLFLPVCPALLDCVELAGAHWRHAARREEVLREIQNLWDAHRADPAGLDPADCRRVQDAAYLLRRDGPKIPGAFYRLRRGASARSTAEGVAVLLDGTEPS
ncbi:S-4TM family putative pore-forming effector [Actinomadura bangladeshensis]|uniref:Uncharacterized protein n=1 Tax=Actinomadura bangladeshensis TaxID=453573 RepID=A0A4R4N6E0_9ACTN|nr:S-4TM family putative pore-forming effector [Actinomadura bangladeshensis]TDC04399.1 hypothetical protein E1284_36915 [Actinomadura bangladeshensis]